MKEASTAERPIEELVTEAVEGSRSALEEIVLRIQSLLLPGGPRQSSAEPVDIAGKPGLHEKRFQDALQ